jgi:hypothetical protein
MRIRKVLAAGALLAATAVLTPLATAPAANAAMARPDAFACYGFGTGATAHDALVAARQDMVGDVTVGQWVYTSGQYSDGSYWEQISADCLYIR